MPRPPLPATLESLPVPELQARIQSDPAACRAILAYLDARRIAHSGRVSGRTLAQVAGVGERTWRAWLSGESPMPTMARRAVIAAAGW